MTLKDILILMREINRPPVTDLIMKRKTLKKRDGKKSEVRAEGRRREVRDGKEDSG